MILDVVRSTMDHPTADWVHRQARRRLPRIGLGTVYRNLKKLAEEGVIREIHTGGHPARFDGNTGRHYHIRCLGCGRVNDLPMTVDTRLEDQAGRAMNYRILGHQVEVLGLCPSCQAHRHRNEKHSQLRETHPAPPAGLEHLKEGSKR